MVRYPPDDDQVNMESNIDILEVTWDKVAMAIGVDVVAAGVRIVMTSKVMS